MNNSSTCRIFDEDPEMYAAIRNAQGSFTAFAAELADDRSRVVPMIDVAVVKAMFSDSHRSATIEHMWVEDLEIHGGMISGTLVDDPTKLRGISSGQRVTFPSECVSDWVLVTECGARGGFTLPIILKRLSRDERDSTANQAPYSWFLSEQERERLADAERAKHIPQDGRVQCSKCGVSILPATAEMNHGICMRCSRKADGSWGKFRK